MAIDGTLRRPDHRKKGAAVPKNLLTPFLIAVLACISPAALADTDTEIRAALDFYAEMWNQDDVDALGGYYDPGFVLITDQGRIALGKRLDDLKAIGKDGGDRGTLSISDVDVAELGPKSAIAHGRIRLVFDDGSEIASWFVTAYRKTPFGWKAVLTRQ
jgi:hypothetical protein